MEEQRTKEWYLKRIGYITGSRCGVLFGKGWTGEPFSKTALSYIYQIASERTMNPIFFEDDDKFEMYREMVDNTSKAMRLGTEIEPVSREWYCNVSGNNVVETGSLPHKEIPMFSASPDGIIERDVKTGRKGCFETKSPSQYTWMQYVVEVHTADDLKKINPEYYYQTFAEMICADAEFTDFVVFNPLQLTKGHIIRIERDDKVVKAIEERVKEANDYINNLIDKYIKTQPA